jgi:hypothetical protein
VLHERRGLCELEEAWLVRSLHRDDGVALPEIARQLGRHRSWVWRRMMLAESLDAAVQGQVRLGLLAPRAAVEVSRLPRGNQLPAAHVVTRTGLTVRQTELLVAELLACGDDEARCQLIEQRFDAPPVRGPAPGPRTRSPTEWLIADLTTLGRVVPRVEARLLDGTLVTLEEPAADLARTALDRLGRSLSALSEVITAVLEKKPKELSA